VRYLPSDEGAIDCAHRIGAALVNAIVAKASALGVQALYPQAVRSETFYARLGWRVLRRGEERIVMSKPAAG
jgi:N-acetylglutamate synthase-like GNAT family acetyltransferase